MRAPTNRAEHAVDQSMLLPMGKTCADCRNAERCTMLFGVNLSNTWCDWAPSRFYDKTPANDSSTKSKTNE